MKDFSFITHSSPAAIEDMYQQFAQNPEAVDQEYRKFFEGFDFAVSHHAGNGTSAAAPTVVSTNGTAQNMAKEFGAYQMIRAYRKRGHLVAG
jgi:2-oxoglutarate dehydrogenase E1 component